MTVLNLIDFLRNKKSFKKVFLNIDYMHYGLKTVDKEIDKIVLGINYTPKNPYITSDQLLTELEQFDEDLPIWIRLSKTIFKPANYIYIAKNNAIMEQYDFINEENVDNKIILVATREKDVEELNISYDYYFDLDDIDLGDDKID